VDVYATEQEQIDALKKWFKEYGMTIVVGLVIGISALAGYRYWESGKHQQAASASMLYENMVQYIEQGKNDDAVANGGRIVEKFPTTPYAILASLMMAKLAIEQDSLPKARAHLEWALANTHQPGMEEVTRLRLARVMLAQDQGSEALALLEKEPSTGFVSATYELKGDIYVSLGKIDEAREAYQKAASAPDMAASKRELLKMKLDDLVQPQ